VVESLADSWEAWIVHFLLRLRMRLDSLALMPGWIMASQRVQRLVALGVKCLVAQGHPHTKYWEALLVQGRDEVLRHRLLNFYIVARQIIKGFANMVRTIKHGILCL